MERNKLSKSQSAAVIECEPVTSTNKLEKPRRVQQQEAHSDNSSNNSHMVNSTLPRSMTVSNKSLHNPYQTSSLRRNVSMTNINDNSFPNSHQESSFQNSSTSNLSQSHSSFQVRYPHESMMFLFLFLGSSGCCQGHCGHGAPEPGGDRSFRGNTGEGHSGILCQESSGGEQH